MKGSLCPILSWPVLQSPSRCIFIPRRIYQLLLYICILVHTNTWSFLAQKTCALWSKFKPTQLLRRKTLLPGSSIIMIITTFPMIDFLTTISVQFCAFSIDWHVNKMRMNQKVNQMTNSLFTLIHHPPAFGRSSNIFLLQKNLTRDWRGGTDSADVLVFVKIIIEIYDFIALNGAPFSFVRKDDLGDKYCTLPPGKLKQVLHWT